MKPKHPQAWRNRLLWRHKTKFILLLGLLFVVGPYLASRALAPWNRVLLHTTPNRPHRQKTDIDFDGTLTVVTYNIAHGRGATDDNWEEPGAAKPARIKKIAALLRDLDADVVILNEVDYLSTWSGNQNQASAIAELAGYGYLVEQRNLDFRVAYWNWRFGNAILSKFPLRDADLIDYPARKPWEDWVVGCKAGVVSVVQLAPQIEVRIAAIHFEHRGESTRLASAKVLEALIDADQPPLIAAGDFNSTPTGFPSSSVTDNGQNTMDWLIENGGFQFQPTESPTDVELTFSSTEPKSVIDWILIPGNQPNRNQGLTFGFDRYQVLDTELSDHRPVIAEIKITQTPSSK